MKRWYSRSLAMAAIALAITLALDGCGRDNAPLAAEEDVDMLIGSSADGAGALQIDFPFAERKVEVSLSANLGGFDFYSGTEPGFEAIEESQPDDNLFALAAGTTVTVEITAIEPGAAMKFEGATLDAVGKTFVLGTTPGLHIHPEWQLTLPAGVTADRSISFKLTTDAAGYSASQAYTATITVVP